MSLNDDILDWMIEHSIDIQQASLYEARKIQRFVRANVYDAVTDRVASYRLKTRGIHAFSLEGAKSFRGDIKSIFTSGMAEARKLAATSLIELGSYEIEAWRKILSTIIPVKISFDLPSVGLVRNLALNTPFEGQILKGWFTGLAQSGQSKVVRAFTQGITRGDSTDKIAGSMKQVYRQIDGNIEGIVRTAANHVNSQVRAETFKANSDIIEEEVWVATLDSRTTLLCASLDGKRFPVGQGRQPPAHFGCRSIRVPVIKGWKDLGLKDPPPAVRASMDGTVPAKTTYQDWLSKKSASFQDRVLGPARGKLFREDKLSLSEMVSATTGRPIPLESIKARS